jgi:hypothetical protein
VGGLLERIVRVSTVSGGSIALAAILARSRHNWPTSSQYLTRCYADLRQLATTTPIVSIGVLARMPGQWGNLFANRARVLAHCLQLQWAVVGRLPSPKLFDIASDQIRSLRSRIIVDAFQRGLVQGAVFRLGNSVRDIDLKSGRAQSEEEYRKYLPDAAAIEALKYPTNLSALSRSDFDLLARHGFELADATLAAYCRDLAPGPMYWPDA